MFLKSFLKWPGGKTRVLKHILPILPKGNRFVEPFVGSGVVFLNTQYKKSLLCDINPDLIAVFTCLQQHGENFIRRCKKLFTETTNTAEAFYSIRNTFNTAKDKEERAALLVYLNRHAYNGLIRYNAGKKYNVPFGKYKKPYFPEQEMRAFYKKIHTHDVVFATQDFKTTFMHLLPGDVVYCDPPYIPLSKSASFTTYAGNTFTLKNQVSLTNYAKKASAKGIPVLISNHDTLYTKKMYAKAKLSTFSVQRNISCVGHTRSSVSEVIALFHTSKDVEIII